MATFYGDWVATDDFRAILEATVSDTSDTQCTVKLVLKVQSNYAYAGSSGRASVTCNGTTRSDSVSYDAGKTTTLMTETFTVARGSSSKSISVSGKVWQINASSAYAKGSTASGKVTIPAIDYDAPNAPSSCAASRVSDTSAKVTWKNGGTTTLKPRSSVKVERQTDGGSWIQIASVGASTANYTDNSISANHRYAYRVRSYGAGGYSGYSTSGYIYTTPAAPSSVTASVVQGTTVRIAVGGTNAPWAESWEVQSSLNGGEWQAVGTYTSFPATADIGGGTVRLRARSLRGSLASAWTESAEITTITPPLAPAVTVADGAPVMPTGSDLVVSWVPNHPDGSAQTQAQIEYTIGDGSPQTATVEGAATSYALPASATASASTVSVRMRTKGADEDWGAWSSPVSVTVAVPPSVHFSVPPVDGAAIGALPLTVEWDVTDSTGVASQSIVLLDASGRTLYSAEPGPSVRELVLGDSTYRLSNTTEYSLRITVRGGSSLTATAERSFRTSFAEPARPTAQAATDPSDMSVAVSVQAGAASSASGEVIEVPATPGTLVPGLTVYGATRQNLWVNSSGKRSGVTVTANEDGSITLSGTATSYVVISKRTYALRPGSTYHVSVDSKVSDSGALFGIEVYDSEVSWIQTLAQVGTGAKLDAIFTIPSNAASASLYFSANENVAVSGTYRIMLNEGSEPEPWCPPGLNGVNELAIVVSTTDDADDGVTTPVDLDGHSLNGLPDGTRDELRIDGTGAVTLVQRVAVQTIEPADWEIAPTNDYWHAAADSEFPDVFGPLLSDKYTSVDTAALTRAYSQRLHYGGFRIFNGGAAGVQESDSTRPKSQTVLYPLAAPQEVELPGISMPSFPADPSTLFAASDVPCAVQVDYPDTDSLSVTRVLSDGSRWLVADGLVDGEQAIDPLPPLNVPYSYEVTASTEAGSAYTTAVEHIVDAGTRGAYNFGPAASECLLTQFDFEDSVSADHGGELYHFAGQGLPLFYAVGQVDVSSDQSFHLIGRDVWGRCRELFRKYPVCWLRKPDGGRQRIAATASIDTKAGSPVAEVSVSGDEVVFEEAW